MKRAAATMREILAATDPRDLLQIAAESALILIVIILCMGA